MEKFTYLCIENITEGVQRLVAPIENSITTMAKKGYFIQKTTTKGGDTAPLYIVVRTLSGTTAKVCTGVEVRVKEWEKAKKDKKTGIFFEAHRDIRDKIESVEAVIAHQIEKGVTSGKDIAKAIQKVANAQTNAQIEESTNKRHNVVYYFKWYIAEAERPNGIINKVGQDKKLSPSYIKTMKKMLLHLKAFIGKGVDLFTFEDIKGHWDDQFRAYLSNDIGLAPASIGLYFSAIRRILAYAATDCDKSGIPANNNGTSLVMFKAGGIKDTEKKRNVSVFLSDGSRKGSIDEIQALIDLPLIGIEAVVRDMFVWGALCGQRISDLIETSPSDFTEKDGILIYRHAAKKTGIVAAVPIIDERAKTILRRNNYHFPKFGEKVYNDYLHKIMHTLAYYLANKKGEYPLRELEETWPTIQERKMESRYLDYKAGKRTISNYDEKKKMEELDKYAKEHGTYGTNHLFIPNPKVEGGVLRERWELVAFHTARRSFATNEFAKGLTINEIAKETGHKSLQTLREYDKTPLLWTAADIAQKKLARQAKDKDNNNTQTYISFNL